MQSSMQQISNNMNTKTPVTLIIMDGFGNAESGKANAISCAATPKLDKIFAENPRSFLRASGLDVGLPDGQMGNSEVGDRKSVV